MRIAYFLADHGIPVFGEKGASVHVRDFSQALCDLGHAVTIFCAKHGEINPDVPYEINKTPAESSFSQNPTNESINNNEIIEDDESDPLAQRRLKETRYINSAGRLLADHW